MVIQDDDQGVDLSVIDGETVEQEKARHLRELKLRQLFADAPEELKGVIDEAKKEPIEDLIHAP